MGPTMDQHGNKSEYMFLLITSKLDVCNPSKDLAQDGL